MPTPARESVPHQAPASVSSAQLRAQQQQLPQPEPVIPITAGTPAMEFPPPPHIIANADARPMAEPTMLVRQAPPPPPPAKTRLVAAVVGAILVLLVGGVVGFMMLRRHH